MVEDKHVVLSNIVANFSGGLISDREAIYTYYGRSNEIVAIDRSTGKMRLIPIPHCYLNGPYSFVIITKYHDNLILPPFKAKEFCIYDLKSRCFTSIPIMSNDKRCDFLITSCYEYENELYCYGWGAEIFKLSIAQKKVYIYDRWYKNLWMSTDLQYVFGAHSCFCIDGKLYFLIKNHGCLLEFDVESHKTQIIKMNLGDEKFELIPVGFDGKSYWMVQCKTNFLIQYDMIESVSKNFDSTNIFVSTDEIGYDDGRYALYDSKIFFFPENLQGLFVYDIGLRTSVYFELPNYKMGDEYPRWSMDRFYYERIIEDRKIIFTSRKGEPSLFEVNIDSMKINRKKIDMEMECVKGFEKRYIEYFGLINEGDILSLDMFITLL